MCFGGVGAEELGRQCRRHHRAPDPRRACSGLRDRGGRIVSFSPLRDDTDGDCEWLAPVPGTDVAIMLALAHVLATEGLADREFLDTLLHRLRRGSSATCSALDDGVAKSPRVGGRASAACPPTTLVALARRMADGTHHGDGELVAAARPPRRAGAVDGADAGGDARPDRASRRRFRPRLRFAERGRHGAAALPAADASRRALNPVETFIPVAAVSDMLLHPGEQFDYNGRTLTYPDIKLRVLGGRQPVPPSPEPPPAAAGARPGRHRRRARPVLDGDGQARRHRRAVDHRRSNATTTRARATIRC